MRGGLSESAEGPVGVRGSAVVQGGCPQLICVRGPVTVGSPICVWGPVCTWGRCVRMSGCASVVGTRGSWSASGAVGWAGPAESRRLAEVDCSEVRGLQACVEGSVGGAPRAWFSEPCGRGCGDLCGRTPRGPPCARGGGRSARTPQRGVRRGDRVPRAPRGPGPGPPRRTCRTCRTWLRTPERAREPRPPRPAGPFPSDGAGTSESASGARVRGQA